MTEKAFVLLVKCATVVGGFLAVGQVAASPLNHMSFESGVPENIVASRGRLTVSKIHRVTGQYSLRWDFVPGDTLTVYGEIGYRPQKVERIVSLHGREYPELSLPTCFSFPIYSEERQEARLRFAFGRENRIDCYTDVLLDFTRWYRFTMAYDRGHLKGAPRPDMDCFKIHVTSDKPGTMFLDDLVFSERKRANNLYPTHLELFQEYPRRINLLGAQIKPDYLLNKPWFPLSDTVSESERQAFRTIESRLFELEWGGKERVGKLGAEYLQALRDRYKSYNIVRGEKYITGDHNVASYDYIGLLKEISQNYHHVADSAQRDELAELAVKMIEHAIDVNDREVSHYRGMGFADACFLMKDRLHQAGLLGETISFLRRNFEFQRLYDEDVVKGYHGKVGLSSDDLYTSTLSRLLIVLLMDDSPEKVRDMRHLVSFYSNVALAHAPGLADSFKPDGTHFHHGNAYLQRYGYYTMPIVCEFVRLMARTEFRLTEEAHERMKENVRARCFYKSRHYFPWAYAHNNVRPMQKAEVDEVLHLALAGTPDGQEEIDEDMAGLYLMMKEGDELPPAAQRLVESGIEPAPVPQGHKTLTYYAKGIHRRDDWFIVVGAFSKYVYQTENWDTHPTRGNIKTNKFVNWGSTEIVFPDRPELKFINNGWDLHGWDWTRFPGATTIKAPLDRFRTTVMEGVEQLRSDQGFVGGLDFSDGNGVFVAKIRGHDKYGFGSFRATKSYFFFGDLMVCLGTGIMNELPDYATQTTLMQNALKWTPFNLYVGSTEPRNEHFFQADFGEEDTWILDSRGIGYYLPQGQKMTVSYGRQVSRDVHDEQDTEGIFETAWLDHGFAPEDGRYEYAVLVRSTPGEMQEFAKQMRAGVGNAYKVIRADQAAHIVEHPESGSRAYALFQKDYALNTGVIKGVSHSSMIMTREEGEALRLAVCDPDLRLYEGHSAEADDQMVRHEPPPYSDYWYHNESVPSRIKIFLQGRWKVAGIVNGNAKVIQVANEITVLEFFCQHGLTNEIVLSRL